MHESQQMLGKKFLDILTGELDFTFASMCKILKLALETDLWLKYIV